MRSGVRCADTIDTSTRAPSSFKISTASCITGRSDLLPMMMPTSGIVVFVVIRCFLFAPDPSRNHLQCLLHFPCDGDGLLAVFADDAYVAHLTERLGEFLSVQV